MATLKIKNFPEPLYEQLQKKAEEEHCSVAQQVIRLLSEALWEGIDPAEYIREERDSWDS